ncbi:hypothetical protein AX16_002219 [Volvariella volvacea WC 439]|nr:hypothetical protein AX16_002219 [Volvariella volvacea WC 439]
MFLASLFLAIFARSLASPVPVTIPGSSIPSPVCIVAAAITASKCDPARNRTLFDILYSCIGVILLCTYISMHHNIPDQNDSWRKVMWMKIRTTLYALIAPEMVIMWAIRQRIMAGKIVQENNHRGWTMTHGFFVQMGGLVQHIDGVYRVAGVTNPQNRSVDWKSMKIPHIPEKEIKDRGKGDLLAKAIVIIQTTWFVAQCVARHIEGLVLTEIELITLAFATLNVITYGLWWDKPLNVGYPIYFDENGIRTDGPEAGVDEGQVKEWQEAWYKRIWGSIREVMARWGATLKESWGDNIQEWGIWAIIAAPFVAVFGPLESMMLEEGYSNRQTSVHPFYAAWMSDEDSCLAIIYGSVIGVLFGAIHLIGWNFQFSTITELWLWRASSLTLTIIPFFLAIGYVLSIMHTRLDIKSLQYIAGIFILPTGFIGAPLYFAARIILLFLAFFTLRALPDTAYQSVRWTELLPHI